MTKRHNTTLHQHDIPKHEKFTVLSSPQSHTRPHPVSHLSSHSSEKHTPTSFWLEMRVVLLIVLSALVTFIASDGAGINAVIASASVGLLASVLPKLGALPRQNVHACVYVGSFAGMGSGSLILGLNQVVSIGLVTGVVFLLSRNWFIGLGGKMGSVAFVGSAIILGAVGIPDSSPLLAQVITIQFLLLALSITLIIAYGTFATFELTQRYRWFLNQPVRASAMVTLVICVLGKLLMMQWPKLAFMLDVELLFAACFCGSFIGMSSPSKISRNTLLLAVIILSLCFWPMTHYLGLYGGALGLMAFIALMLSRIVARAGSFYRSVATGKD